MVYYKMFYEDKSKVYIFHVEIIKDEEKPPRFELECGLLILTVNCYCFIIFKICASMCMCHPYFGRQISAALFMATIKKRSDHRA